jgi:hypothetical protein
MGGAFHELVHRMVGAYEARAAQLYGQQRQPPLRQIPQPLQQKI